MEIRGWRRGSEDSALSWAAPPAFVMLRPGAHLVLLTRYQLGCLDGTDAHSGTPGRRAKRCPKRGQKKTTPPTHTHTSAQVPSMLASCSPTSSIFPFLTIPISISVPEPPLIIEAVFSKF